MASSAKPARRYNTRRLSNHERLRARATWVAHKVIPHEPFVRAWLRGSRASPEEIDELIQDCYCRFAMLETVDHIERPDIYFFAMAKNLMVRMRRRAKVVPIDTVGSIHDTVIDDAPSPEATVSGLLAMDRLKGLLKELPERCRRIVEMRKFDGLSQREIASTLGVTESIVENDVQLGVRQLRAAWRREEELATDALKRFGKGSGRA